MAARLPTKGNAAVWFWAQIRRQELVELSKESPEEVLLTCRVPRERVLLSQFGDWHSECATDPSLRFLFSMLATRITMQRTPRRETHLRDSRGRDPAPLGLRHKKTPVSRGFFLCAEGDLNPHPLSRTSTSS